MSALLFLVWLGSLNLPFSRLMILHSAGCSTTDNRTVRDGSDNASRIGLEGNQMIWTWNFDLLCFHVLGFLFLLVLSRSGSSSRCAQSVLDIDALLGRLAAIHKV